MKALLLSAYDAQSHRIWRQNLKTMFPEIEWVELVLPARYFPWRVRGNSLSWAFNHREVLTDNYDLMLCTSMVDLSALRGFVPTISAIPTIVYFHENQFAYPINADPKALRINPVEPQILSLYSALCADRVIFNSAFNRQSFLEGAQALLNKLPDHVPDGLLSRLGHAEILPVPLDDALFERKHLSNSPDILEIVWNHRWEYDKGPQLLLAIVETMIERQLPFRLHLLGERFRVAPSEFERLQQLLDAYYVTTSMPPGHSDFIENRGDYYHCLQCADVVLSTALHDFQGLSLLEACALGCTPLAPDNLVYPEYLPSTCLYGNSDDIPEQSARAVDILQDWAARKRTGKALPQVSLEQFRQTTLKPSYAALFASTAGKAVVD
jgi:glycosyltransferase involved in cell wall biosynthesis